MEIETDRAVDDVIAHVHRTLELPSYTASDVIRGLVLLTPLGHVVYPKHKPVFDRVWARRKEWYDSVLEAKKAGQSQ